MTLIIRYLFSFVCVLENVQPHCSSKHLTLKFPYPQDASEYAECEAIVKDYPPFREAMKRRGIDDMELVMVDPW